MMSLSLFMALHLWGLVADVSGGAPGFHRKLLVEDDVKNRSLKADVSGEDTPGPRHTWSYLLAALVTALSIAGLIVLVVKSKLFHRYLASYRHARLHESDGTSQCSRAELGVGLPGYNSQGQPPPLEEEDDDGFIEDNYILASERERAEKESEREEEKGGEESDDDDLDLQFTIA